MDIFSKKGDFAAFIKLLEEARRRFPTVRILGYCLMSDHWHLVLWPSAASDLSRFMGWLCTTHVRRWREHRRSVGQGHLYQRRFKAFVVQPDEHLLTLLRYVEGNPLRARKTKIAEAWPWSSLANAAGAEGISVSLSPLPVDRPRNWTAQVNRPIGTQTLKQIRTSLVRSRPFGDEKWTQQMVRQLGLEWTIRDPWRPRTRPAPPNAPSGRARPRRSNVPLASAT